MKFIHKNKMELNDTQVSDLFILNNMKTLQANDIKLYIYILYLLKNDGEIDQAAIVKELGISANDLRNSFETLQAEELLIKTSQGYNVVDLKEVEINKSYTPKFETKLNRQQSELERKRIAAASAINESFFQGVMTLGWYTDIANLFKSYSFSEEVMIALFQYCQERKALNKKYVYAVAETWNNGGVKNFEQLETFLEKYEKMTKIRQKISRLLGLGRNLSTYEEAYVDKWIDVYKYEFDIIEEGLKRSTSTSNPSLKYVDAIITSWYNKGFKTVKEIEDSESKGNTSAKPRSTTNNKKDFQKYVQREYENMDDFYDQV